MMNPIGEGLKKDYQITILDFPGFGKSEEPSYSWNLEDYYNMLDELLNNLNIKNPIVIGHSFGGRVAILYASKKEVSKLVLLSSPFRRNISKKTNIKIKIFKILKKISLLNKLSDYFKNKIGSSDYKNATPRMREILVNVVNSNIEENIKLIKASTVLIWGENDTEVPVNEAKYIEKYIKDCGLIVYEGCSHFAYLERITQTLSILKSFFKGEK